MRGCAGPRTDALERRNAQVMQSGHYSNAGFGMKTRLILATSAISIALHLSWAQPEEETPSRHDRLVLCWYMVCFGESLEVYKQHIELAQRHGIDGFLLDVGAWEGNYVASTERIYEAAKQLGTGFRLAMAPEYSVQPFSEQVRDMVLRFKDHPNQLKVNGKPLLSGYCSASMFPPALEKLKSDGVEVTLVPHVFLPRFVYRPSFEEYVGQFFSTPSLSGLMMFNASELGVNLSDNSAARRATMMLNKICAAGVIPAYNSANLQDYRGMAGYLLQWTGAIYDGADWISIVTWNDYNEDSALMPMRWPAGSERYLCTHDESFLHYTAFASAWFKTGRQPTIPQDTLFLTYRNRSKWQRRAWNGKEWVDVSLAAGRFDQIHDDVQDLVYLDSLLREPADAVVAVGGEDHSVNLPAGIGHAEIPMKPGVPRLIVRRSGRVLADMVGRKQIIETPTEQNSQVGYHAANRVWTCGIAIGPQAAVLEAESGVLGTGAVAIAIGRATAVRNSEIKDSGFMVKVEGLQTATYNIRIRYSNPNPDEARLTLFADGAPRAASDYPYFIPVFLPPTWPNEFQTASFFWSLYDQTRHLKLSWQPGSMWGRPDPSDNDRGCVLVDCIELVKVEPFLTDRSPSPLYPELVRIPGGTFIMGSNKGEPDEQPPHKVTISPFAIGRYEVTNEEFERYDPSHRAFRDGVSWRDREPVTRVSWIDAARYCNWLSEKNGLTPVYSEQPVRPDRPQEKVWVANLNADGFRLPTEAEWEYVASGRGEGRTYPWGNDPPQAGRHGRFSSDGASAPRLPAPATAECGVSVVGAYPDGASRDLVMDMAGNVAEWCTDWYWYPYPSEAQTDPCNQTPGNFRVIRGGSWGWYGTSQRCSDREFNSQNYPGHAYYGFRVAISDAGWKKISGQRAQE